MGILDNKFCKKIKCAFPTPRYLTFDTTGIDISTDAVRVIKLKQTPKGLIPVFFKEVKYTNPIDFSSEEFDISNNEEIVQILKKLQQEFKMKYVICSLPESNTYIYRTKLPGESLSDLASAIRFSLEDNVPLSASECNFEYYIVNDTLKKDEGVDVVVSVYPKKVIEKYTNLLNKADLYPVSFESESVALAESLLNRNDRNAYLMARFSSNKTNVSIVEDGIMQYTSEIWTGSKDLIQNLENEKVENLKTELTKLLIFWFTSNQGNFVHKKIEKAYFVGEGSDDQKIIDFFEKHLKINVDTGNVWTNCFELNQYVPKIDQKTAMNYSVAIGLALKSHKQPQ